MKKILKVIKKYKFNVLLVLVLLVMQAYCDLALPGYTSDIVNIGIQQKGIKSYVPEYLSVEGFNSIYSRLDREDSIILDKYYKYYDNYKDLNKVYVLEKDDSEEIKEVLLFPILSILDNRINLIDKEDFNKNSSLYEQSAYTFVSNEYKKLGIDLDTNQMNYIYNVGFKMLGVAFIAMIITILTVFISSKVAALAARDLRSELVNKVISFEREDIKKFSVSSLITRSTNDIVQIQNLLMVFLRIIIYAPIIGIGAITKVVNSDMSYVIVISVLSVLSLVLILFIVVMPKFKKMQDLLDRLNLVSREILSGLPVIRAFANDDEEKKRFEKANKAINRNDLFINCSMSILVPSLTFVMNSVSILIVWVASKKIDMGTMQVGTMIAFISYTMQIVMSFLMVSMVAIMLPRASVSIKRISEVLNSESKIKNSKKPILLNKPKGIIEFKNVCFKYPKSEVNVIENVSFISKPGTTTAFIGSTGSGKSTLINLIPRFFDVSEGSILLDDINIKDIDKDSLRRIMGYVPQKGNLFSGTVKDNIAFGDNKINNDKIISSLKISKAYDFVMEEGLDKTISESGNNVSGGQRQRLSIARAIYKDPLIYIFDDSFSALDYQTDSLVRKELSKVTKDKTVFIVAQRVSSIMNADNIIVLDKGKIVAQGTHKELLKKCKIYKEICTSQLGGVK